MFQINLLRAHPTPRGSSRRTPWRAARTPPQPPLLLLLLPLLVLTGCTNLTNASKRFAKPWEVKLHALFDDTTDVCAPWAPSREPWAMREHELIAKRSQEADLVAVGQIREVVDTVSGAKITQAMLQFHVSKMLRGTKPDLPTASSRVTLLVSDSEDPKIPKRMIRRTAILYMRWLKTDDPPFRWHVTCATPGVIKLAKRHLDGRAKKEAKEQPDD
jgi:hypothetical protein